MKVSESLTNYYITSQPSDRYKAFIHSYGDCADFLNAIFISTDKALIALKGKFASDEIVWTTRYQFYKYILKKAGY